MKTHLFRVDCLTDMHVGNGEANYSIIDNEVQKDSVFKETPIIPASGVKGALKEHFERLWGVSDEKIKNIFGDKDNAGEYKFFSALCVARPLRISEGNAPYILCADEEVLESFSQFLNGLGWSGKLDYKKTNGKEKFRSNLSEIEIEGEKVQTEPASNALKKLIEDEYAVAKSLSEYNLPIRARNKLDESGKSENIWYEEYVPHKSVFYFAIITPEDTCALTFAPNQPVQFGANASVGNGYTTISEVFSFE